ncbi:MAG: hypothetical protein EBV17_03600, partial [Actinobacteria bacterium]|nr:hypothetical protein [Actinomycetota bacterium]
MTPESLVHVRYDETDEPPALQAATTR